MLTYDAAIAEVAVRRRGLVTTDELRRCGLSDDARQARVAAGVLVRALPGVWRFAAVAPDRSQLMLAATLWGGPAAVVSHTSAAELLHLLDSPAGGESAVHLTIPRSMRRRSTRMVRVHQSAALELVDRGEVDGIPCTTPARTLLDLAAHLDLDRMEQLVEAARHRGLLDVATLAVRHAATAARGRPGTVRVRQLLDRVPCSVPTESVLETRVWQVLRESRLPLPVRQHVVDTPIGRFRLDFAWPDLRLAVECDGFETHGSRIAFKADRRRLSAIGALGWRFQWITWDDVDRRAEHLVARLSTALEAAA